MDPIHRALAELRQGAARLTGAASDVAPSDIPAVIDQLELTLKELSVASYALGTQLAGESTKGRPPLTPAQRERVLATLHAVGTAVGAAARVCRIERRALLDRPVPAAP